MFIVILTGSSPRHDFMRKAIALSPHVGVLESYCEGDEGTIDRRVSEGGSSLERWHLRQRRRVEEDFFGPWRDMVPARNVVQIPKGKINEQDSGIASLQPDLIVAYGCSIIREPIMSRFRGRILNAHLGLSPYYRGSGTNFWAMVNKEPECVGTTFMYMDEGIDTGGIIHQIRARMYPGDGPHEIGNRLIADTARVYRRLIERCATNFPESVAPPEPDRVHVCKKKHFTTESVERLYANFRDGMVEQYLDEYDARNARRPIVQLSGL